MSYSSKEKLGAVLIDLPRFLWSMRPGSLDSWISMRNRDERLIVNPAGRGASCNWDWTSDLHIAKVFPNLGRILMQRVFRDRPVEFQAEPARENSKPDVLVSFIIGHRGKERLPHLLATLRSIAAQRDSYFECIVVEQSVTPEAKDDLPSWVRYVHTPLPYADMAYSRAWAFNVGAREAKGGLLVLHDNDMLVPVDYANEAVARFREGYEALNLKRFIFYLTKTDSAKAVSASAFSTVDAPLAIMQNAFGGSIAVAREAYFAIGGFDESFIGWGGEDNEFWDRAQTRSCWPYGYLPFVHVWHPNQSGKYDRRRETAALFERRSSVPARERIAELTARDFGNPSRPTATCTSRAPETLGYNHIAPIA